VTLLKQSWALFLVVSLLAATAPAGFADQADEPAASAPVGAGREEVLFRRIGGNEATAIETCHALVLTRQREENTTTGDNPVTQYAQTLVCPPSECGLRRSRRQGRTIRSIPRILFPNAEWTTEE
jgi:hypothetical protein